MVSNLKEKLDWAACSRLHSSMPSVIDLSSGYTKGGVVALYSFQGLDLTRQGQGSKEKATPQSFCFVFQGWLLFFKVEQSSVSPNLTIPKGTIREKKLPLESQMKVLVLSKNESLLWMLRHQNCFPSNGKLVPTFILCFICLLPLSPLSRVYVCVKATGSQTSSEPRMNLPLWFSSFHLWSFGIIGMNYTHGLCGAEAPGKHSTNWTASLALF